MGGGFSDPPYLLAHSGPCIVAGNAWCLHDDLARVPSLPVIAVNGASKEVEAFALYSFHPERFVSRRWAEHQRRGFGDDFLLHSSKSGPADHVWPDTGGGGGSAWGARKLARYMGFDSVILCGCPLDVGGYASHDLTDFMARQDVIDDLRAAVEADTDWHEGVKSMSGWTAKLLGTPC